MRAGHRECGAGAGDGTAHVHRHDRQFRLSGRDAGAVERHADPVQPRIRPGGCGVPAGDSAGQPAETEQWLLEHGYALAGSDFQGRVGMVIKEALADNLALLD
jgi:hypothetical protein